MTYGIVSDAFIGVRYGFRASYKGAAAAVPAPVDMTKQSIKSLAKDYSMAVGLGRIPIINSGRQYAGGLALQDLIDEIGKLDRDGLKFAIAIGLPTEAQNAVIKRSQEINAG